jgi:hypothetical protein
MLIVEAAAGADDHGGAVAGGGMGRIIDEDGFGDVEEERIAGEFGGVGLGRVFFRAARLSEGLVVSGGVVCFAGVGHLLLAEGQGFLGHARVREGDKQESEEGAAPSIALLPTSAKSGGGGFGQGLKEGQVAGCLALNLGGQHQRSIRLRLFFY